MTKIEVNKFGKVWLVGAGPSDIGLFTIKGKEVLENAEVVVYDRLVGTEIFSLIPKNAKLIDVGKRAGNHTKNQKEINQILLEEAKKGLRVVRLKGGDPFLFGRGGEELELLVENGIHYEIVPGVTSAISVPAYNGIPVTHRDFTSSLHIITGHKCKSSHSINGSTTDKTVRCNVNKPESIKPLPTSNVCNSNINGNAVCNESEEVNEEYDIDFEALVRTKGTLVFLMGVSSLGDILKGLMNAGMELDMPAAILQQGTTFNQKRIVATVATLEEKVREYGIETPAIIVVGKVCELSKEFYWYEKLPLFGEKIIITRPQNRISVLDKKLRALGSEVLQIPAIETVPLPISGQIIDNISFDKLPFFNYLVFTSPYGVEVFFNILKAQRIDIRKIGTAKIAAIGSATARAIEEKGLMVDIMPEVYDGKSLGKLIANDCKSQDKILIPRSAIGNPELVEEILKNDNISKEQIIDLPIYDIEYSRDSEKRNLQREQLQNSNATMIMFTSASTVRGFNQIAEGFDYSKLRAVCIGAQTKKEADKLGMQTFMAEEATIDSMVECAVKLHKITIEEK